MPGGAGVGTVLWEHSLKPRVGARAGPDCGGQAECREAPGEECSPGGRSAWASGAPGVP